MVDRDTLNLLPDPDTMKRNAQTITLIDRVIMDRAVIDDGDPVMYRYVPRWRPDCTLFHIGGGNGDELSVIFTPTHGTVIRGFDHEVGSEHLMEGLSLPPRVFDGMPAELAFHLGAEWSDPSDLPMVSFAVWRGPADTEWKAAQSLLEEDSDDGSYYLRSYFPAGDPLEGALEFWGVDDRQLLQPFLDHEPLTASMAAVLIDADSGFDQSQSNKPVLTLEAVVKFARLIGYPVSDELTA